MSQALRILLYYLIILGLAYILVKFIPFRFESIKWQFTEEESVVATVVDSIEAIETFKVETRQIDSLSQTDSSIIKRDVINVNGYLSFPEKFGKQLMQLRSSLIDCTNNQSVIRILHFGDSQIEGDRITAHIREAFQNRYGGSGPGLINIIDFQRLNPSVWLEHSKNWKLHSIYEKAHKGLTNQFGLMGQTAHLPADTDAFFKMSRSPWAEPHASNYHRIRLFIAPHSDSILINGFIRTAEIISDTLSHSEELTEINWTFEEPSPALKIMIRSEQSLNVLACALDSTAGVAVDNIALRGQNTPLLQRTDGALFQAMGEHLQIGMVIFQYGTNMIPIKRKRYDFYKQILSNQFNLIKTYMPEVPVLVVGISDAAYIGDGEVRSYEHLASIRDAQKETAHMHGFAFYDLYEAMGGDGAIIKWSKKSPPLALTDYIHFTRLGGKKVAEMINKSIFEEFEKMDQVDTLLLAMPIDTISWNKY